MQSTAEIACIEPRYVRDIWPAIKPLLKAAIDRTRISAWQPIADDILSGKSLVWLCRDGGKILCAGATSLKLTDFGLVCVVVACGGSDMDRWVHLLDRVELYAKAEGCARMRIFGRRGWLRILPDYRMQAVILDKELH